MQKFVISGGKALRGSVTVSGSKNAALPIIAATLLTSEPCTLKNVPDIKDVRTMLALARKLGATYTFQKNTLNIQTKHIKTKTLLNRNVKYLRASILFLGPLLARVKKAKLNFPGGCLLGKRSVSVHLFAMRKFGAEICDEKTLLDLNVKKLKPNAFVMPEISVTATENAIMVAVLTPGTTQISLAAAEPHVQDLCHFLEKMGAKIDGIGTHTLYIHGAQKLRGATHEITPDYLETGTLALAAVITRGTVTLKNIVKEHLDSLWAKLEEAGAKFSFKANTVTFYPVKRLKAVEKVRTAVFPAFPTDLQAPFAVLLTQAKGKSEIFETLFENRLNYLYELEKMGAKMEIVNRHEAVVHGPTELRGVPVASCDIRAGAAMLLAALIAKGETEISNIRYIDRGYERLDRKLQKLGAVIRRVP